MRGIMARHVYAIGGYAIEVAAAKTRTTLSWRPILAPELRMHPGA